MLYQLLIDYDSGIECPNEWGSWTVIESRQKLKQEQIMEDRAFMLSRYEHGNCVWSINSDAPFDFDTTKNAGVLIWQGNESDFFAMTPDQRKRAAESFLVDYTKWCNGQVYWYQLTKLDKCSHCNSVLIGEEISACGGYYDVNDMLHEIRQHLEEGDEVVLIKLAKELVNKLDLQPAIVINSVCTSSVAVEI